MPKSIKLSLAACLASLLICVFSFAVGELYFRGTDYVNVYCTIGIISLFLFLGSFGIVEILVRNRR